MGLTETGSLAALDLRLNLPPSERDIFVDRGVEGWEMALLVIGSAVVSEFSFFRSANARFVLVLFMGLEADGYLELDSSCEVMLILCSISEHVSE